MSGRPRWGLGAATVAASSGRPAQAAPAQDVAVEVRNGFAAVGSAVDDESIAALLEAKSCGDIGGCKQQMAQDQVIIGRGFSDSGNGFLGNEQHVHRGLRFDVPERQHAIVLVNDLSRNFAGDNFFKEGLAHSLWRET